MTAGGKGGGRGYMGHRTFFEAAAFVGVVVQAMVGSQLLSAACAEHHQSRVADIRDGCKPSGLMGASWQSQKDRQRSREFSRKGILQQQVAKLFGSSNGASPRRGPWLCIPNSSRQQ